MRLMALDSLHPQVAVSKRIIVVDDHAGSGLIALINPEITHAEGSSSWDQKDV